MSDSRLLPQKQRFRPGIRTILVLCFTLACSTPLLIFGLSEATRWANSELGLERKRMLNRTNAVAMAISERLDFRLSELRSLSDQVDFKRGSKTHTQNTAALLRYINNFQRRTAVLIGLDGYAIAAYPPTRFDGKPGAGTNYTDREYFKPAIESAKPYISSVVMSKLIAKPAVPIVLPKIASDQVLGLVVSSVPTDEIDEICNRILREEPDLTFVVTDAFGRAITRQAGRDSGPISDLSGWKYLNSVSDGPVSFREGTDPNGVPIFGAVKTIPKFNSRWTVAIYRPLASVTALAEEARVQTIQFALLAIAVSTILAFLVSRWISSPIIAMADQMQKIGGGNYDSASSLRNPRLFIRELVSAWEAIEIMSAQLKNHTENLESLVSERTRELTESTRELEIQRAKSIEGAKLAALGEMAGGIAHEINNPLTIIHGTCQVMSRKLQNETVPQDQVRASFVKIESTVLRISKIVKSLRQIARDGEQDCFTLVSLQSVINDTLEICQERFRARGIELQIVGIEKDIELEGRPVQLCQVLLNLLNNAYDAVENAEQKVVRIEVLNDTHHVELAVSDSGHGVPFEIRDKILQPFFTTKDIGKGTGLGLSISRSIARSHSGDLWLDTSSSKTRFVLQIPKKKISDAPQALRTKNENSPQRKREND